MYHLHLPLDQILEAQSLECANNGNYIYIVQCNGAPGTKRPMSCTCFVLSCTCSLQTASVSVELEISTSEDDSHGSEDDCRSKTEADRWYRDHEEDDDDDDDFIIESMMLNFDDAEYRRAKTSTL